MQSLEFLEQLASTKSLRGLVHWVGENPVLERRWAQWVRGRSAELIRMSVDKKGPEGAHEEALQGTSLFSSERAVLLELNGGTGSWTKVAKETWSRMVRHTSDVLLVVQSSADKRLQFKELSAATRVDLEVLAAEKTRWLKLFCKERQWSADASREQFLLRREPDLSTLETWVELWSLGGDAWASVALGWGSPTALTVESAGAELPQDAVFVWVDAVLQGQRERAVRLARRLVVEGQDPIPLVVLLGKSARILASLDWGLDTSQYPSFLVQKLRPLLGRYRMPSSDRQYSSRLEALLEQCADVDLEIKTGQIPLELALERLSLNP